MRQLLVENLLVSGAAAALGLLLAAWLIRLLHAMPGASLPRPEAIAIDLTVLLFTIALAVVTPLLFGLLPSFQISRTDLRETLAQGGRASLSPIRARVRSALVAAEVAIALLLLVGATLLIRSFWNVMSIDAGFDPRGVVTAEMAVPQTKYPEPSDAAAFYADLLSRLRSLPGVSAAGVADQIPLGRWDAGGIFRFAGETAPHYAGYRVASENYFDAMGIPLRRGRTFDAGDVAGRTPVAVVNDAFVSAYLASQDPIGKRFAYLGMDPTNPTLTIVGVVGNVRHRALVRAVQPEAYVAYRQCPFRTTGEMTIAVRAEREELTASLVPALRAEIQRTDAEVPVQFGTLRGIVSRSVADRRFLMTVLTAFAGVALLLAAIGIYGVVAYSVSRRLQEIGVRMALGADAGAVIRLVLRGVLVPVAAGIAAGLAATAPLTRVIESLLFAVKPADPAALGIGAVILAAAALAAAYVPARRATKLDPLATLRRV